VPDWLVLALRKLHTQYPEARFEVADTSDLVVGDYIRCLDCPRTLFPVRPGNTAEDFVIHLTDREHKYFFCLGA
jgi:hypothetical protein